MSLKIYRSDRLAIALLLLATGGMGTVIGMSFPLVTLLLQREGFSASLIGVNSAMGSLAILVVGLLSAKMLGRHGAFMPIIGAMILSTGSLLALPFAGNVTGWFLLRFTLALGLGFMWLLNESWLNMLSKDNNRGKIVGLYASAFSGGFAFGPLIVTAVGSNGPVPFAVAAAVMTISALPVLLLADRNATTQRPSIPRSGLLGLAPFVFFIALAAGLFETTAYALLPVYTLGEGLGETGSLYALSAFSAGGIALQYPLGRLADIAGRRALMTITAAGILILLIALPYATSTSALLMPILFVWGGMVFGLYTTGLIMLGDKYRSENLVAANALFIIFYEVGAVIGPALSGGAMDVWPRHGFTGSLLAMAVLLVVISLYQYLRRIPADDGSQPGL